MSESLPTEVQQQNWDFLMRQLTHSDAQEKLATSSEDQMEPLLRDHKAQGVSEPSEILFRRNVDIWLGQASMLYLAYLSGYATFPEKSEALDLLLRILGRPALRAYYERFYPVAVPWLLRLHLEGKSRLTPEASKDGAGAFERFSILYERFFRSDENLQQFLDFLDGFWYGGPGARTDIRTVVDSFKIPERVADAFGKSRDQLTRLDGGILGMIRFWTFSQTLDELLRLCREMPRVQSGFWFFYAYWFQEYDVDVAEQSERAIDNAVKAIRKSLRGATAIDGMSDVAADQNKWQEVMKRLTSGEYAKALVAEMQRESADNEAVGWIRSVLARLMGSRPGETAVWISQFGTYTPSQLSTLLSRFLGTKP